MNNEPVSAPGRTMELLRRHGITLKKSLGQNFVVDTNVLKRIVDAAELAPRKGVLEIGPGIGALTEQLALAAGRVVAVEIDGRLLPALREMAAAHGNVEIVHADILKTDLRRLFETHFADMDAVSVAANLPYYATTPIIMRLLETRLPLEHIVVMVQKEVADRMGASPGTKDYGSLSVAVQFYCEAKVIAAVPPSVFIPRPDVDSAVIRLTMRRQPAAAVSDEKFFFEVVRAAFAQRRKTILNNMQAKFGKACKADLAALLENIGIDPGRRGETLSIAEFAALSEALLEAYPKPG